MCFCNICIVCIYQSTPGTDSRFRKNFTILLNPIIELSECRRRQREGFCEQGLALWHYFCSFFLLTNSVFVYNFVGHKKNTEYEFIFYGAIMWVFIKIHSQSFILWNFNFWLDLHFKSTNFTN